MAPLGSLYDDALQKFCSATREDRVKDGDEKGEKQLQDFLASRATAQQARDSAFVLKDDAGKKYSAKKHGDKEIISQKWIDNIFGNIGNAIDVGDKLLKGTPESVSMAWFCVKLGLNAMQSNYQLYSLFGSGLTSMTEIMILIPHYDQLYDERQKPGFEPNDLIEMLFRDVTSVYAAVLEFLFSVKRHIEASGLGKARHALEGFLGVPVTKFQEKQDNIASLKAKVLEGSEAAFQKKLFDKLGIFQDSLKRSLDEIHSFASTAKELAEQQSDILREVKDIKAFIKPKSRWDWLKQDFDTNRKVLDPLSGDPEVLRKLLAKRHLGTTSWLLESDKFADWKASKKSAGLCFIGQRGAGKSVMLASAVRTLESTTENDAIMCFVSCVEGDGKNDDLGTRALDKITRSLIYQIYKLAAEDERNPDVLEACNKLFDHPKAKKKQQMLTDQADDNGLPRFVDAVLKLAGILHKNIIFVVDAVDRLPQTDQSGLFDTFRDVMERSLEAHEPTVTVRVLTTCRTGKTFANRAFASDSTVDIEGGNSKDMSLLLSSEMEDMADWTTDERAEAGKKVLTKAGTRFGYISEVAIPFLRQPFQRPLSKRLEDLPEGITDSYIQTINSMSPNYLDLLRTALTWTLYSAQTVRVKEVMEAFSGAYGAGRDGDVPNNYAERLSYNVTKLELEQLQDASGPFLKVTRNLKEDHIVSPSDYVQIRQFCDQAGEKSGNPEAAHTHEYCVKCRANLDSSHRLELPEKQVHLDMALQLVRHLNNPLFQKRFGLLLKDRSESSQVLAKETEPSDEDLHAAIEGDINATEQKKDTGGNIKDRHEDVDQEEDSNPLTTSEDLEPTPAMPDNTIISDEPSDTKAKDEYDSDDSQEDEDRGEVDIIKKLKGQTKDEEEDDYDGSYDDRYEINQWFYHARKADAMWPAEEKVGNPKWTELIAELDRLAFENESVFKEWQFIWAEPDDYIEKGVGAIHLASYLGLTFWVEHLVKDLEKDPMEFSEGRNALQAAALRPDNNDVLRLLLRFPGMDATVRGASVPTGERSALQEYLNDEPAEETVKLFVDSGADFNKLYEESGDAALHFFAAGKATDPAVLTLILESGGTDERRKPAINAKNDFDNTPLHFLMLRRDVPLDLLRAFISNGANVNAENKSSLRPLQSACSWSEPELVTVLLPFVSDIDDPDEHGTTALHAAAWAGSSACVRLLLENKANINHRGKHGRSALHFAAWKGHVDTINTLLERGADLNVGDIHGRTPFWFACNSESKESAALLLAALRPKFSIAIINSPSKRQRTPLRLAATHGFSEIVQELITMTVTAGLDVETMLNLQDTKKGFTALNRSAWRGELDCVRTLLHHGADATLKDMEGDTALTLATMQWKMSGEATFEKIVLLLIEKDREQAKVDPELPATAASNGSVGVLERLYRVGANVNRADNFGWTPLMHAQRLHKSDVERFLKRQIAWGDTLPSAWVHNAATAKTVELSKDGLEITYKAGIECSMSTDKPLPAGLDRYYYEVTLRDLPAEEQDEEPDCPLLGIGFCTFGAHYYEFPGWPPKRNTPSGQSWAYHGDDGWFGAGSFAVQIFGEPYGPGDTVGCGVDLETRRIWFTKQGKKLEFEHEGVKGRLFPILGLSDRVSLETNFGGKPFMWAEANVDGEGREVGDATAGAASLT